MMRKLVFLTLLLLCVAAPAHMQDDPAAAAFDALVPGLLETMGVPGAALARVEGGALVWEGVYGLADVAAEQPVTTETVFQAASLAKGLTTWAVLSLVEAGQLDLDAPVTQYLTRWELNLGRFRAEDVTLRRMLSHTAGLSVDGYDGFDPAGELPTLEALLDDPRLYVSRQPGARFSYSGGGFMLAQLVIEEVTGTDFRSYMQQTILDPLEMTHTGFGWTPDQTDVTMATGYLLDGSPRESRIQLDYAAGGLYTTAGDLARFLAAHMTGPEGEEPGRGILSAESIALILTPAEGTDGEYGLGYYTVALPDGSTGMWHDGISRAYRALVVAAPASGDGLVILTNYVAGNAIMRDITCAWDEAVTADLAPFCRRW